MQSLELIDGLRGGVHAAGFIEDDHAEAVAGVEEFGRGRVMGSAVGIAAVLLEGSDAEILEGVGNGGADAGVVLVVAGAVNAVGFSVEDETLVGIEADGRARRRRYRGCRGSWRRGSCTFGDPVIEHRGSRATRDARWGEGIFSRVGIAGRCGRVC